MKKLICGILSIIMLLSLGANAFAADSEPEAVVKIAKSRLSIPAEFSEFTSEKYTAGGTDMYNLFWRTDEDRYSEISVSVLPSGEIISYNLYDANRDYDKTGVAAFEKEEYLKCAKTWLEKVNPSYVAELDTDAEINIGSVYSYNARVNFKREINGIQVDGDGVYISLDKYTGNVTSMNSQWTHPKKIQSTEDIISTDEAGNILGGMAGLSLRYKKLRDKDFAVLMYEPTRAGMMIDAVRGEEFTVEFVESDGDTGKGESFETMNDSAATEKEEGRLTEEELANIEELKSLLSKDELSDMIRKMAGTYVASFTVKSVNYREVGKNESGKVYEAHIYLTNADGESANVTFDAKTGELKSLYTYTKYEESKRKTKTRAEMKTAAERFINKWAADVAEKAEVFGDDETLGGYIVFTQSENGIEYAGNSIRIRVDERSGKILSFSKNWNKQMTFDSADGIIPPEEATEKYIDAAGATLYYIANGRERYAAQNAEELALIYRFSDNAPAYIDAKTGAAYDWNMGQAQESPEKYEPQKDLAGHWAEKAVKTLADNGIVLSYEETFRPDEVITQKEIALLMGCFGDGYRPVEVTESDYNSYIESLVRQSIIKSGEKNPDKKVTREETVSYLVRMFGFGDVAEIAGIYKTGFSDEAEISKDKVGYVALAKGLGIASGSGGAFNPKNFVTRAELAMMLYNALDK